jgi:hypothetical protein
VKENGTCLQFLIGESALVRPVAGAGVMADQLHQVNEIGELANVSTRIVPAGFPAASRTAGFEIIDVPEVPCTEQALTLVFVERPEKGWEMLREARAAMYGRTFSTLLRQALSDEDSRELIAEVARMFGRRCRARWRLTVVPRVSVRSTGAAPSSNASETRGSARTLRTLTLGPSQPIHQAWSAYTNQTGVTCGEPSRLSVHNHTLSSDANRAWIAGGSA